MITEDVVEALEEAEGHREEEKKYEEQKPSLANKIDLAAAEDTRTKNRYRYRWNKNFLIELLSVVGNSYDPDAFFHLELFLQTDLKEYFQIMGVRLFLRTDLYAHKSIYRWVFGQAGVSPISRNPRAFSSVYVLVVIKQSSYFCMRVVNTFRIHKLDVIFR